MLLLADASQWLFFLGIALMTVILLRKSWRRSARVRREQRAQRKTGRPRPSRDGIPDQPLADAPPELLRWHVEMQETARELSAQLDSKIRILQQLTQTAEAQIATLQLQVGLGETSGSRTISRLEAIERLAEQPLGRSGKPLEELLRRDFPGQPSGACEHVYALADLGVSTKTIAQQLDLPVGDVEMLLSLRAKC